MSTLPAFTSAAADAGHSGDIFGAFTRAYEREKQDSLSIQEYLEGCRNDPGMYASAPERMVAAVGEPKFIDTSADPRLSRIEGQVRGVQKMIDTERNCLEIVHQISAIINALRRVQNDMLRDHLTALGEAIIAGNLLPQERREMADELAALFKQLS